MTQKNRVILIALLVAAASAAVLWLYYGSDGKVAPPTAAGTDAGAVADQVVTRMRVVVSDHLGSPVAGATVEVAEQQGTTDASGLWTSGDLEPGHIPVVASAEGYINTGPLASRREVHVASGADVEVPLTLRKPGTISGRIAADGEPVEARLSLLYAGEEFAIDGAGESSADGTFTLENVPPGRLRILVETEEDFATTESREIAVDDGETVAGVDIDLSRAGTLAGKVRDEEGKPIAGADIFATGERSPRARRATTTDTGGFRIDHFPAGVARVRVSAEGFTEEVVDDVTVEAGEVAVVEVTLQRGSGVWGTVKTRDGRPAGAAIVLLRSPEGGAETTRTRKGGTYRFHKEPGPGSTVLAVSPYRAKSEEVEAKPGARIDLTLGGKGSVRGRVVDAAGQPVTEFEVGVESMEVDDPVVYRARAIRTRDYVSSDGTFEFGPLRPGQYWLRATASGHAPGSAGPVTVKAGATTDELVITLTSGGSVAGRVTDQSGKPLAKALVVVFDPMSPFKTARTRTGPDGRYELEGVPPGRRSLRASKRGYLSAVSSGISVPSGGAATRDIQLGRKKKGERFSFHGIGAVLEKADDGSIRIRKTMEGKPAAIFGLQEEDRIVAVDGQSTSEMRLGNVVELIRGEEGAGVELTLQRQGEGRVIVEVERGRVVVK